MLFAFCCWTWEADSLLVKIFCVYNCCEMHLFLCSTMSFLSRLLCIYFLCPTMPFLSVYHCAFIFLCPVMSFLFGLPPCFLKICVNVFSVWSTTMLFKDLCQCPFCLIYHHAFKKSVSATSFLSGLPPCFLKICVNVFFVWPIFNMSSFETCGTFDQRKHALVNWTWLSLYWKQAKWVCVRISPCLVVYYYQEQVPGAGSYPDSADAAKDKKVPTDCSC